MVPVTLELPLGRKGREPKGSTRDTGVTDLTSVGTTESYRPNLSVFQLFVKPHPCAVLNFNVNVKFLWLKLNFKNIKYCFLHFLSEVTDSKGCKEPNKDCNRRT